MTIGERSFAVSALRCALYGAGSLARRDREEAQSAKSVLALIGWIRHIFLHFALSSVLLWSTSE